MRIGQGYDVHQLVEGRDCIIGGVKIPYELGLLGHSDADVLLHAITDGLIGALAMGDIGSWFPDNDPQFKDIDSSILLLKVYQEVTTRGWKVVNIDTNLVLENPRLKPFREKIQENIAKLLELEADAVSIKARTAEKMGAIGRGEGIAAFASVLIEKHG